MLYVKSGQEFYYATLKIRTKECPRTPKATAGTVRLDLEFFKKWHAFLLYFFYANQNLILFVLSIVIYL